MKVIFSRKGFDSGWGGWPSPILPDGRMVSLPIPDNCGMPYADLRLDGWNSYAQLMSELGMSNIKYPGFSPVPLADARAHLDPDVMSAVVDRLPGWRPMFGQVGSAQGHLHHQGVGPGDVFVFYGWFQPTVVVDGRIRRTRTRDRVQALWGYLEVEQVLVVSETSVPPPWARSHPHFALRREARFEKANTVYVATERLTVDPRRPGAGSLGSYRSELRLTRPGSPPSIWELPLCFHPDHTSFPMTGNPRSSWSIEGDRVVLRAARRGQEFVTEANDGIQAWWAQAIAGLSERPANR
jgi:Nucleotide modification associated domain 3